jgi:hypothetical protein
MLKYLSWIYAQWIWALGGDRGVIFVFVCENLCVYLLDGLLEYLERAFV